MIKISKIAKETRIDMIVGAFLTTPSVMEVCKTTGIPRSTVYQTMKLPEFQDRLAEARQKAMDKAVTYMQGSLVDCAETLVNIAKDSKNSPQVRINAINTIFQNCRGLTNDNPVIAGMAVKIIDDV